MCLMVSGLLRMFEKFTGQLGWNNPDLYWNSLLNLVDWFANVILPVYAGMHVAVGALKFGNNILDNPISGGLRLWRRDRSLWF